MRNVAVQSKTIEPAKEDIKIPLKKGARGMLIALKKHNPLNPPLLRGTSLMNLGRVIKKGLP